MFLFELKYLTCQVILCYRTEIIQKERCVAVQYVMVWSEEQTVTQVETKGGQTQHVANGNIMIIVLRHLSLLYNSVGRSIQILK